MLTVPSIKTLDKYGLSLVFWKLIAAAQGYVCAVCGLLPKSGRLCIDHEHVSGFKKLPPEKKRKYVRGLLCWNCNYRFAARGMTEKRARRLVSYLVRYAERRTTW